MTTIASFAIEYFQFLNPEGREASPFPEDISDSQLLAFYRDMVFCRVFDKKAVALQRTGRISTYPPLLGEEALDVGIAHAMNERDVFLPYYRNTGTQILRGVSLEEELLYYGGNERGCDFSTPKQDFPTNINLSTQVPHAVGVAMAMKLRDEPHAAVTTIGDGACSKGDFYEALNLAGVWQAPVLFVAMNNQWAISVPYEAQTAAATLAQKAIAAGVGSEQVDGNDVIAVFERTRTALERIRSEGGPYLLELKTYRLGDHTTADNASRYRDDDEVTEAWQRDPIARLRSYLSAHELWTKDQEEALLRDANRRIEHAVEAFLDVEQPAAVEMIDHLFAELPKALQWQRDVLAEM